MHLLLIRHAQSLNNRLYAQTGGKEGRHPDPPLSDVGFEQARLLGEAANRIPHLGSLTHLYSSLTTRAVQTVAPLATALALPVQGVDTLHEIGGLYLGQLTGPRTPVTGQTRQALQRICPELHWPAHLDGRTAWDGGFEENDAQVYADRARTVAQHPAAVPEPARSPARAPRDELNDVQGALACTTCAPFRLLGP